jgi:hypothetical protein
MHPRRASFPPVSPLKFIEIITQNKRIYNNPMLIECCEINQFGIIIPIPEIPTINILWGV